MTDAWTWHTPSIAACDALRCAVVDGVRAWAMRMVRTVRGVRRAWQKECSGGINSPAVSRVRARRGSSPRSEFFTLHEASYSTILFDRWNRKDGAKVLRELVDVRDRDSSRSDSQSILPEPSPPDDPCEIGRGTWGIVRAQWMSVPDDALAVPEVGRCTAPPLTRVAVATKTMPRTTPSATRLDKATSREREGLFRTEWTVLRALNTQPHPNIVRLHTAISTSQAFHLVLERCPGVDLVDCVLLHGRYAEADARILLRQLLDALNYLHSRPCPISHRDVKPENVIVDHASRSLKLVDFGLATRTSSVSAMKRLVTYAGTDSYAAPEILKGNTPYDGRLADAWSAAAVGYVMVTGFPPFNGRTAREIAHAVKHAAYSFNYISLRDVVFSSAMREYMQRSFEILPRKRRSIAQALHTPGSWMYAGASSSVTIEKKVSMKARPPE